jgi:hypothetical protein
LFELFFFPPKWISRVFEVRIFWLQKTDLFLFFFLVNIYISNFSL